MHISTLFQFTICCNSTVLYLRKTPGRRRWTRHERFLFAMHLPNATIFHIIFSIRFRPPWHCSNDFLWCYIGTPGTPHHRLIVGVETRYTQTRRENSFNFSAYIAFVIGCGVHRVVVVVVQTANPKLKSFLHRKRPREDLSSLFVGHVGASLPSRELSQP